MGNKIQGIRSIIGRHKINGEVKNSIGNGEAQELICKTHGHELMGESQEGRGLPGGGGQRGNICNSIINKIYLKIN